MFLRYLIIFFVFSSFIRSQQIINQNQGNQPIEIYAEKGIEWHKNENKYLAIGNAKATQGSLSLKSDLIEAFYEENKNSEMDITKVQAHKNVPQLFLLSSG